MSSAIDATKPADGIPASKADLRANLQTAKVEIEALQTTKLDGVEVQDDGSQVLAAAQALDFRGDVAVSDQGNGLARVTVTGGGGGGSSNVFNTRDFGTVGDGVADDTAALQAAFNAAEAAGGGLVVGHTEDTYLVDSVGTKPFQNITSRYCLELGDGVRFHGHWCTIKLADGADGYALTNKNHTSGNQDIEIAELVIDGNRANQAAAPAGGVAEEIGGIGLYFVTGARIHDVLAKEIKTYAGRFIRQTRGEFYNLSCIGSDADGWSFGLDALGGGPKQCFQCRIDDVHAEDLVQNFGNKQGNPVIGVFVECTVGKLMGKNASGGIKIQGNSKDSTFDALFYEGGANGTANSGVKVQGNQVGTERVERIAIGQIVAKNCHSEGLRVSDARHVTIGRYVGFDNAASGDQEIFIESDTNELRAIKIADIRSVNCQANSVVMIGDGVLIELGTVYAEDPTLDIVDINALNSSVLIGSIIGDSEDTTTQRRQLSINSATCTGRCELVVVRGDAFDIKNDSPGTFTVGNQLTV